MHEPKLEEDQEQSRLEDEQKRKRASILAGLEKRELRKEVRELDKTLERQDKEIRVEN